jgi:hypothetical protein
MEKERIYITHIGLHVRDHRQTLLFSKVAEKGRIYTPISKGLKNNESTGPGSFNESIELPKDLMERINRDEVELMMPEGGVPILAGKDVEEYLKSEDRKLNNRRIHLSARTWHPKKKGVK